MDLFENLDFNLKQIAYKIKKPITNICETYNIIKKNKIDVVHCHMTLMNCIPLFCAKMIGTPIRICHSHNCDVRKKNIIIKFVEGILKKICIRNATVLVACGKDAGQYMYNKKKYIILNNALVLEKFKFDRLKRQEIRKMYNISEEDILIGHIGRFTEQKNHKFIIEVFNKLNKTNPKYKLALLGEGKLKSQVEESVANYKLDVIFTGCVNNVSDYYSAFDIFVLPSLWEGLPVVGVEAQASGLICLFSKNIDENVEIDKEKVLFLDNEIQEWENKIIKLKDEIYNRATNEEMFKIKNLNIKEEFKKLEDIYLNRE